MVQEADPYGELAGYGIAVADNRIGNEDSKINQADDSEGFQKSGIILECGHECNGNKGDSECLPCTKEYCE